MKIWVHLHLATTYIFRLLAYICFSPVYIINTDLQHLCEDPLSIRTTNKMFLARLRPLKQQDQHQHHNQHQQQQHHHRQPPPPNLNSTNATANNNNNNKKITTVVAATTTTSYFVKYAESFWLILYHERDSKCNNFHSHRRCRLGIFWFIF